MAQSAVILSINEKNLLKNLKYTFTTGHQFIAELMQNARRSGSPEIRISVTAVDDDKSDVFVCDEGRGIEDMQSLFTVAGSDWDTDIQDAEQPFGMGFVSALFAAPKITVRSNGAQLTCRTDEIFAGAQVPVESTGHDQNGGTEICLYGVPMLAGQLRGAVEKYASGFPIPVTLDGKPVHRAFAADSGIQYIQTPIGLLGLEDGKTLETLKELPSSNSVRTLLQGLPIDTNGNSCYGWDAIRTWVLHLDTQQFKPRMPDRGSVMDAERACEHIRGTVKGILIDELARRLAQLGPEAFVQQHADMACRLAPELMNALDVFPGKWLDKVAGPVYKIVDEYEDPEYRENQHHRVFRRNELDEQSVSIVDLDGYDESDYPAWLVAMSEGRYTPALRRGIPPWHWLNSYIEAPSVDPFVVVPMGNPEKHKYLGEYVSENVIFCDAFEIQTPEATSCCIDHCALYDGSVIYYPRGLGWHETDVLRQVTDFVYGEHYESGAEDIERERFAEFLQAHLCPDLARPIEETLNIERLAKNTRYAGKAFTVRFIDGGVRVTEQDTTG